MGLICHPDERSLSGNNGTMVLQRLPLFILVEMDRTRTSKLTNPEESVIPIQPVTRTFCIKIKENGEELIRIISDDNCIRLHGLPISRPNIAKRNC